MCFVIETYAMFVDSVGFGAYVAPSGPSLRIGWNRYHRYFQYVLLGFSQ